MRKKSEPSVLVLPLANPAWVGPNIVNIQLAVDRDELAEWQAAADHAEQPLALWMAFACRTKLNDDEPTPSGITIEKLQQMRSAAKRKPSNRRKP